MKIMLKYEALPFKCELGIANSPQPHWLSPGAEEMLPIFPEMINVLVHKDLCHVHRRILRTSNGASFAGSLTFLKHSYWIGI
jgi:hypothetical protein